MFGQGEGHILPSRGSCGTLSVITTEDDVLEILGPGGVAQLVGMGRQLELGDRAVMVFMVDALLHSEAVCPGFTQEPEDDAAEGEPWGLRRGGLGEGSLLAVSGNPFERF